MKNIFNQINQLIENEKITISFLERKIGASKGVLSRASNNNTDIQSKWIQLIVENYPNYNSTWLLTGEGEMLRDGKGPIISKAKPKEFAPPKGLPLIPIEAVAGIGKGDITIMEYEKELYKIPLFKDKADFLIGVSGSSMTPKYYSGDILACKHITDISFLQWGKVYVLDTDQGALVKRLYKGENIEEIICFSDNKDMYPEFTIPKSSIRTYSLVIGSVRLD